MRLMVKNVQFFVIFSNLAVLLGLITWRLFLSRAYTTPILDIKNIAPKDILAVGFLGFISFSILVTYANFYPLGGWGVSGWASIRLPENRGPIARGRDAPPGRRG